MFPDTLETEHGREHYARLMTGYEVENLQAVIARCHRLLDQVGIPADCDLSNRVAYAVGSLISLKEIHENV